MNPWTPPGPPGPVAVPTDVRTATQLWWGVIGFGVLRLILSAIGQFNDRHELARKLYEQVHAQQPQATLAEVELMVVLLEVVVLVLGLGIAAGAVAVVFQMRRGKRWARAVLDVAAAVLLLGGLGALFGLDAAGTVAMLTGAAAIVQAVLAGGALFLCHRGESETYFRMNTR
ncbi:hypothetical protein NDR87_25915 [Nocardia sp. CDC159]|uniref:Uncharacterized protein n=1 Tax=Nocardia pulmonis TaxID=2951408 RepID=A0A9X2EB43_9NOCA|nr:MULTISPECIES: hypothetical protein [Nocardia]MCM6774883.1 hypothetical protein [Nocardia pulmonis]MCM6789814.1 hypothetical protein [Nocardia sp. CDC159]